MTNIEKKPLTVEEARARVARAFCRCDGEDFTPALDALIAAVRREALQEATNEAWTYALEGGHVIADRIRALAAKVTP